MNSLTHIRSCLIQNVGILDGNSSRDLDLRVLPICAGIHTIDGISIVNAETGQELFNGKLCDVLVQT